MSISDFYRKKVKINHKDDDIIFQSLEWSDEDIDDDEIEGNKKYLVRAFGVTDKGRSITVTIKDFPPFIYIKVPSGWGKKVCRRI